VIIARFSKMGRVCDTFMVIKAAVNYIYADGYMRLLCLSIDSKSICVYLENLSEFVFDETEVQSVRIGDILKLKLTLECVVDIEIQDEGCIETGLIQPNQSSSTTELKGVVAKVNSLDSIAVKIDEHNEIGVEFERDIKVRIGEYVKLVGSLSAEIIE
jgi:hypothetical protein